MMVFAFYLFAILVVAGGLFTVMARHPVHSVLWLILTFFSASGLFILQGAEFVAMLLVIVYVGAVAVLFLFVVMMLDVDFAALRAEMAGYLPVGLLIGLVLLAQLGIAFSGWELPNGTDPALTVAAPAGVPNTNAIAAVLYDRYLLPFMLASLVLLVAMIGAIVLTMRHRRDIKRQNVLAQMYRDPAKSLEMHDVKPGQGL